MEKFRIYVLGRYRCDIWAKDEYSACKKFVDNCSYVISIEEVSAYQQRPVTNVSRGFSMFSPVGS